MFQNSPLRLFVAFGCVFFYCSLCSFFSISHSHCFTHTYTLSTQTHNVLSETEKQCPNCIVVSVVPIELVRFEYSSPFRMNLFLKCFWRPFGSAFQVTLATCMASKLCFKHERLQTNTMRYGWRYRCVTWVTWSTTTQHRIASIHLHANGVVHAKRS